MARIRATIVRISPSHTDFLNGPSTGHAAEIYSDERELARSVAAFLAEGLAAGEAAIVVATPEHALAFEEELQSLGWDAPAQRAAGMLVVADAAQVLESVLDGDEPSPDAFAQVVGALLDRAEAAAPGGVPRVFGEMVDLLAKRSLPEAAIGLELLWNALARERAFALLCGYELDVFDRDTQAHTLPGVCRVHSHVRPAQNYVRLARSVDSALDEVLGRDEAGRIYLLLSEEIREGRVPLAQLILMWVSANMPARSKSILDRARSHYLAPAPA